MVDQFTRIWDVGVLGIGEWEREGGSIWRCGFLLMGKKGRQSFFFLSIPILRMDANDKGKVRVCGSGLMSYCFK